MSPLPDTRFITCHQRLTAAGYRCHQLHTQLEGLEARLLPTRLTNTSLALLVFLVTILLGASFWVDVLLLRALAEYVVSLAGHGLEEAARWLVPAIILGLEMFVSLGRAREQTSTVVANDPFAIYDPKPEHKDTIWRVLGFLLLLIQPLGASATYSALQNASPEFSTENQILFAFLLAVGLAAHLAVLLFAGTYLLALANAIEQTSTNAKIRRLRAAYLNAAQELLRLYRHWRILRDQHPGTSSNLELDPLVATEIQYALQLGQVPTAPPQPTRPAVPPSAPTPGTETPASPPPGPSDPPNPYAPANDQWGDDQRL